VPGPQLPLPCHFIPRWAKDSVPNRKLRMEIITIKVIVLFILPSLSFSSFYYTPFPKERGYKNLLGLSYGHLPGTFFHPILRKSWVKIGQGLKLE